MYQDSINICAICTLKMFWFSLAILYNYTSTVHSTDHAHLEILKHECKSFGFSSLSL